MNSGQDGTVTTDALSDHRPVPVPVIDHVVVNVRERLPKAAELYSQLGFTLTPEGRHTLGSINHLAMFGADYMELLGVPSGGADRADVMAWPCGLTGIAFACKDADAVHASLAAAGAPVLAPLAFSRPVVLAGKTHTGAFRVVRVAAEAAPVGRLFFCHHLSPELVWRDEWRRHPNGTLGIAAVVIGAVRPETLGALFGRLFGADALVPVPGGLRLAAGLASIDIIAPAELRRRYGDAAPMPQEREAVMAALTLRTLSRDRAATVLRAGGVAGVQETAERILVPASAAMGVAIAFQEG